MIDTGLSAGQHSKEVDSMKPAKVPDTVQAIIAQAGGLGMRGAFVYVGARNVTYRCSDPIGESRSNRPSRLVSEGGAERVEFGPVRDAPLRSG